MTHEMKAASGNPPPLPRVRRRRKMIWIVMAGVVAALAIGGFAIKAFMDSGITRGPDEMFGDQHLKTTVALIELHKTRHGEYPKSLGDLEYIGSWDPMAIASVSYVPSADQQSYYVEVQRGWVGKPLLRLPEGFWKGTGYDPKLNPAPDKPRP